MVSTGSTTTPASRITKLIRLRDAWNIHGSTDTDVLPISGTMSNYDFQSGILALSDSGQMFSPGRSLVFHQLRSNLREGPPRSWKFDDIGFEISDFATDPSQDLLVLIEVGDDISDM